MWTKQMQSAMKTPEHNCKLGVEKFPFLEYF